MNQSQISSTVRKFIAEHIESAELLEALLLIHSDQERDWSPDDIARSIYTVPASATRRLEQLVELGLATSNGAANPRYQWAKASPLADEVDELAETYRAHRVAIINMIYARPADPLRSFADAFKLRKD
jgi:hypothetical protein